VLLLLASGTVPFRGEAVILPIAGIPVGGAMTATSLAGRRRPRPSSLRRRQLLVLLGLLAAEMLAVWAVTELVGRGALLERVPR